MRPQVEEKGSAFACVALLLTLFVDLSKTLSQPWRIPELRYLKNGVLRCAGPTCRALKLLESYATQPSAST